MGIYRGSCLLKINLSIMFPRVNYFYFLCAYLMIKFKRLLIATMLKDVAVKCIVIELNGGSKYVTNVIRFC